MVRYARVLVILGSTILTAAPSTAATPDWSAGVHIITPRANPYGLAAGDLEGTVREGRLHALEYPVTVSGVMMPWRPFENFINGTVDDPLRRLLGKAFAGFTKIRDTDDLFARLGLHPYPSSRQPGLYDVPFRGTTAPSERMGVTLYPHPASGVQVFTLSCAACHSGNLFGRAVIGMSNRFPQANEFFVQGKKATSLVGPGLFASVVGATSAEADLYARLKDRARAIGVRAPVTEGLDASLAQVAMSLARRSRDEYASFNSLREMFPEKEILAERAADSKPMVWWNLKYKNRWLSDGSVVSGNPIYTNFLWNEIGRGTDLRELEHWLDSNPRVIEELTTAVFATEAPRYTDFFPADRIIPARAKHGEQLFQQMCQKCHGSYAKVWSQSGSMLRVWSEQIKTAEVRYPEQTKVIDVGTDPLRHQGMTSLARGLNPLAISKKTDTVIVPQKGYVPPPLVGIWARWPYFHNNSAPSLCAVLTPAALRPVTYWAGEALNRERDFDDECNGYPSGENIPAAWKTVASRLYDTRKPGLANTGHDQGILIKDGREILTAEDKRDLIQFLKTL